MKLRAGRVWDLPRLRTLWRMGFPGGISDEYFFAHCFVPDHVESSLVLLEDGMIQSAVYFLPTFWYDQDDRYMPAPCLVGLSTAKDRQHRQYASWLVETACDFMVEKGAGGVWTLLPDDSLELFFAMQGFWTMPEREQFILERSALPEPSGEIHRVEPEDYEQMREVLLRGKNHVVSGELVASIQRDMAERSGGGPSGEIHRVEPEDYEQMREVLLRGKNHVVSGELVASIQRDMAERSGGGMFLMDVGGAPACAVVTRAGADTELQELLCPAEKRPAALALLAKELPAERYTMGTHSSPCGMLRLMNGFAKMEQPQGYLGCGPLL